MIATIIVLVVIALTALVFIIRSANEQDVAPVTPVPVKPMATPVVAPATVSKPKKVVAKKALAKRTK